MPDGVFPAWHNYAHACPSLMPLANSSRTGLHRVLLALYMDTRNHQSWTVLLCIRPRSLPYCTVYYVPADTLTLRPALLYCI